MSWIWDWWIDHLQRAPETCTPSGTRFRERTPRRLARRRQAEHSRAMRPRWLAWAAFILDPLASALFPALDYSLFVLLYWESNYAAGKNQFGRRFPNPFYGIHKSIATNIGLTLRSERY